MAVTIRCGARARLPGALAFKSDARSDAKPATTFAERALTRRRFLTTAASSAAITVAGGIAKPSLSRAADRPRHHARHPVGRRLDRFRRGLGARRPAVAHAGRGRDHRQLQRHPQRGRRRRACRKAISPPRRCSKDLPAGQDIFYRVRFEDHVVPDDHRASRRSGASAPRRTTGARSRSSGRATPRARAGASTRRAAACAPTRPCCDNRPDFFIHSRRQHLCRLPDPRAS